MYEVLKTFHDSSHSAVTVSNNWAVKKSNPLYNVLLLFIFPVNRGENRYENTLFILIFKAKGHNIYTNSITSKIHQQVGPTLVQSVVNTQILRGIAN